MAGSMTDLGEKAVLDYILRNATMGLDATNIYVILGTAGSDTGVTELAATGAYARVAVNRTGSGWDAATGNSPSLSDNTGAITFPTATADWNTGSNIGYFGLAKSATVGTADVLWWGDLTTAKSVLNGDTASFAAGELDVTQD